MGIMTVDIPADLYYASGGSINSSRPPAIHLVLSKEQEDELLRQKFALYQGSGGVASPLLSFTPSGASTQIDAHQENKLALIVNEICLSFGLTKEELAQVCNIQSRKTLYNWINGEAKPRKAAMSRIYDLLLTSKAWASSGFGANRDNLHQPIINNQSIFDLLRKPEIDQKLILFAGSRLNLISPVRGDLSDPFA